MILFYLPNTPNFLKNTTAQVMQKLKGGKIGIQFFERKVLMKDLWF